MRNLRRADGVREYIARSAHQGAALCFSLLWVPQNRDGTSINNPVRMVAFNGAEGWARDVTREIVDELRYRCAELEQVPASLEMLLDRYGRA